MDNLEGVSQRLINAVLDEDIVSVKCYCKGSPEAINMLSINDGNGPIHISIYLRNSKLLRFLLRYGADPNLRNSRNDTPSHVAVKIGYLKALKILHSTGQCQFLCRNSNGESLLDMAHLSPSEAELRNPILCNYGKWRPEQKAAFADEIIKGRQECVEFIRSAVNDEYETKRIVSVKDMVKNNSRRQHVASILRAYNTANEKRYISRLDYPMHFREDDWTDEDIEFFNDHLDDVKEVTHKVFCRDFVRRAIRSGIDDIQLHKKTT